MDLGLAGRTALVLGAGGGLGGSIAATLAREGANVAVADIDAASLEKIVGTIRRDARELSLHWDISDLTILEDRVAKVEGELGPIDILINNTGGPPPTTAGGQKPELWTKHFESMVMSVIAITDRVLPEMRTRKWGRVVTSTSSGVVSPIPNLGVSNALRMTLVGWSKTLAREVARDGVTCNIVLPGRIATARIGFLDEQRATRENRSVDAVRSESAATIPLGRYGKPEEYADVVTFLASERASYITGSVIRVDGGLIASV